MDLSITSSKDQSELSNENVIRRIEELVEEYRAHPKNAGNFERSFEFCLQALEFVDLADIHQGRLSCAEMVRAHFCEDDIEFGDHGEGERAACKIPEFLNSIPRRP